MFERCYPKLADWLYFVTNETIDLRFLPVYSYGFWVAMAFLSATVIVARELKRREKIGAISAVGNKNGVPVFASDLVGDMVMICAIFGILGANFFNYLENPGDYSNFWNDPIGSISSGLSVYGGVIASGIALLAYAKWKKINIPNLFDALCYGFILANGIGRIGCQVSGDSDWGVVNLAQKPSFIPQFLWASNYAHNIADTGVFIAGCVEQHCMVLPEPVYPTPLYEFLMCTVIFFVLHFLRKKWTNKAGLLFCFFLILLGIQRYSIEQIRDLSGRNLTYIFGVGLKQAELISIILIIAGILGGAWTLYYYSKRTKNEN